MKNADTDGGGMSNSPVHRLSRARRLIRSPSALAMIGYALLTLAMFGDVLFTSRPVVLSNQGTDLFHQFIHWRNFGFEQLKQGNLALWNPHLFSGAPYFGGFQAALLYPLNFLFMVLPLAKAINLSVALHVFLAGAFTYCWTLDRGLRPLAAFLSGVMFMFCGAHFLHIYAGHLPNLCTMIWAPLLFLAIDRLFARPSLSPTLLGMFAVAMQILAGHPQYVFYTAVAAGIYSVLRLIRATGRLRIATGLVVIYLGGAALSAVQLLTGLDASRETLRSTGTSFEFAAMFSFPPENILTLVAPTFFGNMKQVPYWGRCYLWEMSLFLSVTGLLLAVYGGAAGSGSMRKFSVCMVVILFVLALGAHTPLFRVLYEYAPGFAKFRGSSKFIFLASLFIAMLAGIGLDRVLGLKRAPRALAVSALVLGVVLGITALVVRNVSASTPENRWTGMLRKILNTRESYLPEQVYSDSRFQFEAARNASRSLAIAGGTFGLASVLLLLLRRSNRFAGALVSLAVIELFAFARSSREVFNLTAAESPDLKTFLAEHPGDYRILNLMSPNSAMSIGASDLWGYDPGVPMRYAQFMAFTQGMNPAEATQYIPFRRGHRLYSMLRCRHVFVPGEKGGFRRMDLGDALPLLQLVQRYRMMTDRNEILATMDSPSFDPRTEVVLETTPSPEPTAAAEQGTVTLLDVSSDHLTIEADLSSASLLVITDTYGKGWRARSLPGSSQAAYHVLPANYCLRAVPLGAGHHRFRVEYLPWAYVAGKWISLVAICIFGTLAGWMFKRRLENSARQKCAVASDSENSSTKNP